MSELRKLEKQVDKSKAALEARRTELDSAIFAYANAVAEYSVNRERLEQAEALEAVREARSSKAK